MARIFGWMMIATAALGISSTSVASEANFQSVVEEIAESVALAAKLEVERYFGLDWKVGDKTSHSLKLGFINGSQEAFVREDTGTSIWMQQDMDLGFMGKQKVEILMNKSTGAIEKLLMNGKEQEIPEADVEVVEMKEDKIRVPAGEFECIYAKVKNNKDGSIQEVWINPGKVPMGGNLKVLADSQFGKVVQELKAFTFATR